MKKLLQLLLLTLILNGCSPPQKTPLETNKVAKKNKDEVGIQFIQNLQNLITRSDRIIVTEHSNEFDFIDGKIDRSLIPEKIVYKTKELSPEQSTTFLGMVKNLDDKTEVSAPACIFEPHHSIAFFSGKKQIGTMEICFGCGQVEWTEFPKELPAGLITGLAGFISQIGMEPKRDWHMLAQKHKK